MTYDMVAASIGYPTEFGTIAQIKRLTHWACVRVPGYASIDVYFAHGVVVKYVPPQEMP